MVGLGAAVSVYTLGGNLVSSYAFNADDNAARRERGFAGRLGRADTKTLVNGQIGSQLSSDALGTIANPGNDSDGNPAPSTANSADIRDAAGDTQDTFDDAKPGDAFGTAGAPGATTTVGSQTVPRGTSAFIGRNANVDAGRDLALDAHERIDLQMVGGGLGVGGLGIGAGIAIVTVDERVQAFIGSGATVSAATVVSSGRERGRRHDRGRPATRTSRCSP